MAHLSESKNSLQVELIASNNWHSAIAQTRGFGDVCVVCLPERKAAEARVPIQGLSILRELVSNLGSQATLVTTGDVVDLVETHIAVSDLARYQHWIAIKRGAPMKGQEDRALPHHHFGAIVHTKYSSSLRHARTRIRYEYCPSCDRTTKDYGGKKHTYNEYGTLMSDVWRDIPTVPTLDLMPVIERLAVFLAVPPYERLRVLDLRGSTLVRARSKRKLAAVSETSSAKRILPTNCLIKGDVLEVLRTLPTNSVDFAFADPPYNLRKAYVGYSDDLEIKEYFAWCDEWLAELARILKPGRSCAVLNIPLWAIRHFFHLRGVLNYQNWITWDALSYPVRLIMPAHYSILCFAKGQARKLPGLTSGARRLSFFESAAVTPQAEGFCLRSDCIRTRAGLRINDRGPLTDLWWDIHRLKHNARRVDHPCQLPPTLMYRLVSIFTEPNEVVLDCFDGAGTTSLAAHQLGRKYIGVEVSEKYHNIAVERHAEIGRGLDPFRKEQRTLTAKNSPVARMPKQRYEVAKKTLQLDVRRIARQLGRLPTRGEVEKLSRYPIKYFDSYFASWGEVCAAARHSGMSERRNTLGSDGEEKKQHSFLFDK